jgi:hypothetical protein
MGQIFLVVRGVEMVLLGKGEMEEISMRRYKKGNGKFTAVEQ